MTNSLNVETVVEVIGGIEKEEEQENVYRIKVEQRTFFTFYELLYFDGLSFHYIQSKVPASGVDTYNEPMFSSKEITFGEALLDMKHMKPQVSSILDSIIMSDYSKARLIMDSILEGINIGKNDD